MANQEFKENGGTRKYVQNFVAIGNDVWGDTYVETDILRLWKLGVRTNDALTLANDVRTKEGRPFFGGGGEIADYLESFKTEHGTLDTEQAIEQAKILAETTISKSYFKDRTMTYNPAKIF